MNKTRKGVEGYYIVRLPRRLLRRTSKILRVYDGAGRISTAADGKTTIDVDIVDGRRFIGFLPGTGDVDDCTFVELRKYGPTGKEGGGTEAFPVRRTFAHIIMNPTHITSTTKKATETRFFRVTEARITACRGTTRRTGRPITEDRNMLLAGDALVGVLFRAPGLSFFCRKCVF